jgi:hypothetical protein
MTTTEQALDAEVAALIEQQNAALPKGCGWADYEIRAISNKGSFDGVAVSALGFTYEHFEMRESQAVSCDVCGGLFKEWLSVMRRHRLRCGWGSP